MQAANTFAANGLLSRNVGGASTFYSFDPQGNVCQRFNSSGQVLSSDMYDAYGAVQRTPSTTTDVFGFGAQAGYYADPETGLLLLTNRYYDPAAGRFLSPDPIGLAGGANLYRYAWNNPATYGDPSGESPVLILAAGIALYLFLESEQPADVVPPSYVHTTIPCQLDELTTFGQGSQQPTWGGVSLSGVPLVSIRQLKIKLGKAGMSVSDVNIREATPEEMATAPRGARGWTSSNGNMEPILDAAGRPTIVMTPAGLSSTEEAVTTVGHELSHIRDFSAGVQGAREIEADQAGYEFWLKFLSRLGE